MPPASSGSDREKFDFLLQLASDQVRALEAGDLSAFDRILSSKDTIIASFQDARGLLAADASLGEVIRQIRDADQSAQRLLYHKTGHIMRELTKIQQQQKARRAYVSPPPAGPHAPPAAVPRYMDQKS